MSSSPDSCFENFFNGCSNPEIFFSDHDIFLSEHAFSPFLEEPTNYGFQELSNSNLSFQNPNFIPQTFFSSSPPNHQLENLTTNSQTTHLQPLENGSNFAGFPSFLGSEEQTNFINNFPLENFFDVEFPNNNQNQNLNISENGFLAGHDLRREVQSKKDLQQKITTTRTTQRSCAEEGKVQVRRYTAEERKQRISKYRAKRSMRNFTKTIKYLSRKIVADNRPRIRGRFARDEETVRNTPNGDEANGKQYTFGQAQFQYCGF